MLFNSKVNWCIAFAIVSLSTANAELAASKSGSVDILGNDAYAGVEGEILGEHLASAAASKGASVDLLGLAGASADEGISGSILKRREIDASVGGSANILGDTAYAGAEGELLGDHLASAAASQGASIDLLGLAGASASQEISGSILKRREIDASRNRVGVVKRTVSSSIGGSADLLGNSAYAGAEGELLGDHLASAAASKGATIDLLGLAGASASEDISGSILKRREIDASIGGSANILGDTAYAGAEGELLGDHLASAAASQGASIDLLGLAGASASQEISGSILKRREIDASIGGSANILGNSAYAGAEAELLGDHLASAAASQGATLDLLGLAGASANQDISGSIL